MIKNNGANINCGVVWRQTKDKEKGVKKGKISGTCADCSRASWFLNVEDGQVCVSVCVCACVRVRACVCAYVCGVCV